MSDCVNDFWNTVGQQQICAGGAPSVRTKEIKEYESGKRSLSEITRDVGKKSTPYKSNLGYNYNYDHDEYIRRHKRSS